MPVVQIEDVTKSYDDLLAIRNVTLEVQKDEVLVMLGPNGSGKSTLLQVISTALAPDRGNVEWFGGLPMNKVRKRIGMVFDHSSHWDLLTGFENAYYFARSYGLGRRDAQNRLEGLFDWFGLMNKKDEPVETYSYGMRRKLSIIEGLVHDPPLLLMDEPSMGLDHMSRAALQDNLRELASNGRAVVITTNDVHEASAVADRVLLLDQGRLMALGTPDELLHTIDASTKVTVRLVPRNFDLDMFKKIDGIKSIWTEQRAEFLSLVLMISAKNDVEIALSKVLGLLAGGLGKVIDIEVRRPDLGDVLLRLKGGG